MQNSKISKFKKWFTPNRKITQMQAIEMFAMYRLGAVIFRLKEEGWVIKSELHNGNNFATYTCISMPSKSGQKHKLEGIENE